MFISVQANKGWCKPERCTERNVVSCRGAVITSEQVFLGMPGPAFFSWPAIKFTSVPLKLFSADDFFPKFDCFPCDVYLHKIVRWNIRLLGTLLLENPSVGTFHAVIVKWKAQKFTGSPSSNPFLRAKNFQNLYTRFLLVCLFFLLL